MPTLGKGTECIKLLLSQTSKDMHEPLVPMLFPILRAHVNGAEFQYPDLSWKELCVEWPRLLRKKACRWQRKGMSLEKGHRPIIKTSVLLTQN